MVNGIKSNDREKQKRLVNFYVGFIFIKENDLQTKNSRTNIEKGTEIFNKGSNSEKALSCPKGIQVSG